MLKRKHGIKISKKLTHIVRSGQSRHIVITDKDNKPVLRFPILFFVVITLIMPILVGILVFLFLLSEYHAVIETS